MDSPESESNTLICENNPYLSQKQVCKIIHCSPSQLYILQKDDLVVRGVKNSPRGRNDYPPREIAICKAAKDAGKSKEARRAIVAALYGKRAEPLNELLEQAGIAD